VHPWLWHWRRCPAASEQFPTDYTRPPHAAEFDLIHLDRVGFLGFTPSHPFENRSFQLYNKHSGVVKHLKSPIKEQNNSSILFGQNIIIHYPETCGHLGMIPLISHDSRVRENRVRSFYNLPRSYHLGWFLIIVGYIFLHQKLALSHSDCLVYTSCDAMDVSWPTVNAQAARPLRFSASRLGFRCSNTWRFEENLEPLINGHFRNLNWRYRFHI
jgi:hypothetical protein